MNRLLKFGLLAAALASAYAFQAPPAEAANVVLCQPRPVAAAAGPGVVTNPVTTTSYSINSAGCAVIARADVGYFQSQGYTQGPNLFSVVGVSGVLTGTTAVQIATLPPSTYIQSIVVNNTTANAVTGGIDFNITGSGAGLVSALTCAASCLTFVTNAALLLPVNSLTAQTAVSLLGHTDGNSANLTVTIMYSYY